jgi:hypothetical protein
MGRLQVCDGLPFTSSTKWRLGLEMQEALTIVAIPAVACISAGHNLGNNPVPGFEGILVRPV